jgi:hypothetical protein
MLRMSGNGENIDLRLRNFSMDSRFRGNDVLAARMDGNDGSTQR